MASGEGTETFQKLAFQLTTMIIAVNLLIHSILLRFLIVELPVLIEGSKITPLQKVCVHCLYKQYVCNIYLRICQFHIGRIYLITQNYIEFDKK